VGRLGGALLVAAYFGFIALTWRRERRIPPIGEISEAYADATPAAAGGRSLLLVVVGLGVMTGGGQLAVSGATRLVATFDATDSAIGLTLLALATTAELFALVWSAARRGLHTLAVAGILGSVAYNATLTLGLAALSRPLVTGGVVAAAAAATGLPVALLVLSGRGRLGRGTGLLLVAAYAGFVLLALR
jgi:cation:H+ antiporter